ncbi:MAG: GlsB/YeaQ/YmgE family stress response membrane protein [Proteobacteria bacterium]|nr:MAG: GlsB/YeaQ/YmgE family stress response membrane protein [Pseudomonadota bacterium]
MFALIGFIISGLIIGLIARALKPGDDSMSLTKTTLLGMAGSMIAGWLGRAVGWYGPEDGAGFIVSTVGAIALLAVYYAITHKRGRTI